MTEAVMLDHELKQAHLRVRRVYSTLMGRNGRPTHLYGIFEVILYAYPAMDAGALVARIEALVADHGPDVRKVVEDHSPGAADYVLSRDRLYDGPKVLLVADLARHYPSQLRAVTGTADFSLELESMAFELKGRKPGASASLGTFDAVDMMAMNSPKTSSQPEVQALSAIYNPIFSEPEVVKAVVVPDLDPDKAAPVFSSPF